MSDYRLGDLFFDRGNEGYQLYKLIRKDEDQLYVRAYWPSDILPVPGNLALFDLRTTCETVAAERLNHPVFVAHESITPEDETALRDFLRIRDGIAGRSERLEELMRQGEALIALEQYTTAVHVFTEAASFSKYNSILFDRRGYCYLQLNELFEAISDLEHSLSISPENPETLFLCAKAYARRKNFPKAIEKLERLLAADPLHPGAMQLLSRLREH